MSKFRAILTLSLLFSTAAAKADVVPEVSYAETAALIKIVIDDQGVIDALKGKAINSVVISRPGEVSLTTSDCGVTATPVEVARAGGEPVYQVKIRSSYCAR